MISVTIHSSSFTANLRTTALLLQRLCSTRETGHMSRILLGIPLGPAVAALTFWGYIPAWSSL